MRKQSREAMKLDVMEATECTGKVIIGSIACNTFGNVILLLPVPSMSCLPNLWFEHPHDLILERTS